MIAELLSGEEIDGLKEMFNLMDVNKTGVLTFEEFKAGLHKMGSQLAENEIQQLLEAVSVFLCILNSKYFTFEICQLTLSFFSEQNSIRLEY